MRRYLAGAELADLTARRRAAAQSLTVCRDEERELHEALEQLDAEATSTTAELSSRREEDLANALGRVQGLVERARGTSALLRERGRAVVAALDAAADVDVVSTLEAEGARLATELAAAEADEAAGGAEERAGARGGAGGPGRGGGRRCGTAGRPCWAPTRPTRRSPGSGPASSWWPVPPPGSSATSAALAGRVGTLEQREAGAAVRADLLAKASAELEAGHGRARGRAGRPHGGARGGRPRRGVGPGVGRRGRGRPPPHGGPGRGARACAGGPAGRGRARAAA